MLRGLENQLQAELHRAAAAVEGVVVEERRARRDEDVARVQGIGIGRTIESAVVGRQSDAEVSMVKCVKCFRPELQRETFRQLRGLEHAHVPDVESWS